MALEKTIEERLHDELIELRMQVSRMQERGEAREEIEMRTADFEMNWFDEIRENQRAEIAGSRKAVELAVTEFANRQKLQSYAMDAALLPTMSPEKQIQFWNSTNHGNSITDERDRAMLSNQLNTEVGASISEKYNNLRYGLSRAVEDIENGRPPSLTFELNAQLGAEQRGDPGIGGNDALAAILNKELAKHRESEHEH